MPVETRPIGGFPKSEAIPNPSLKDLSLEQLQEMIEWPHKIEENLTGLQPEPTPPPSEPEPISEPEPVAPTPEPSAPPEPAAEPAPPPSQENIDAEILKAQFEALEAHAKKMEAKLTGREAGEKGYIKQLQAKISQLEARVAGTAEPEFEPSADEPERVPARRTTVSPDRDAVATWAVQNAVQQATAQFAQGHPDLPEVQKDIEAYIRESGYNAESVLLTNDPISAMREVNRVLEEAYWHVSAAKKQSRVAELQAKRADQVRGLEEAKKKASISGSGGTPPAPAPRKTTADLSLSELENKMRALGRR